MQDRLGLKYEVQRKLIHILTSAIPLALYFGANETYVFYFTLFLFAGFITADVFRMNFYLAEKYFFFVFSPLLRTAEQKKQLTGATYLFLGMALTLYLFSKEAAVPALLFLTLADPAAAIAGKQFGIKSFFNKTPEGSLAFFLTASAVILGLTSCGWAGLGVALFATIVEGLPLRVNDNLLIPLVSGFLLQFVT